MTLVHVAVVNSANSMELIVKKHVSCTCSIQSPYACLRTSLLSQLISPDPLRLQQQTGFIQIFLGKPICQGRWCSEKVQTKAANGGSEKVQRSFSPLRVPEIALVLRVSQPEIYNPYCIVVHRVAEAFDNAHHNEHAWRVLAVLGIVTHRIAMKRLVVELAHPKCTWPTCEV